MMVVLMEHQKQQQPQQQQHDMTMMKMRQRRRRIIRRVVQTERPLLLDHEEQQHRQEYPFLPSDLLPPVPTSNTTTGYYRRKFYPTDTKAIYVSHGCLLIPVFLAAWWYYTKRAWYRTCRKFRPAIHSPTNCRNCRRRRHHHHHSHRCYHHSSSGDGDVAGADADPATDPVFHGTSRTFFTATSSNFRGASTMTRSITSNNNHFPPIFCSDDEDEEEEEMETANSVVSAAITLNGDRLTNSNSDYHHSDVEIVQHEFARMTDSEYDNNNVIVDGSENIAGRQKDIGRSRMRIWDASSRQQLLFQQKSEDPEYNTTSERPQSQKQNEPTSVSRYSTKELLLASSSSQRHRRRCVKWINRQNVSHRQQKKRQPYQRNGHADDNFLNVGDVGCCDDNGDDGVWECIPDMNDVEFCSSPASSDGGANAVI